MNEEFIIEFWTMAKGYMDKNHLETAAEHYIDLISDHYDDLMDILSSMRGHDSHLDDAIDNYIEEHEIIFSTEYN